MANQLVRETYKCLADEEGDVGEHEEAEGEGETRSYKLWLDLPLDVVMAQVLLGRVSYRVALAMPSRMVDGWWMACV